MVEKNQSISKQLTKLQSTTCSDELFIINTEAEIGSISGFRLGRTKEIYVPNEEINAALGQVVYLLCV